MLLTPWWLLKITVKAEDFNFKIKPPDIKQKGQISH